MRFSLEVANVAVENLLIYDLCRKKIMTPLDKHSHLITIWQTFRLTNARKLTVCNHNFMVNIHNAYNTNLYFSCYLLFKEVPCCNPKRSETHALPIVCYNTVILVVLSPRIK